MQRKGKTSTEYVTLLSGQRMAVTQYRWGIPNITAGRASTDDGPIISWYPERRVFRFVAVGEGMVSGEFEMTLEEFKEVFQLEEDGDENR